MSQEVWKAVVGYEGRYEVSSLGRVRGLARLDNLGRRVHACMLKPNPAGSDRQYLYVGLCANGEPIDIAVHRLVLEAFAGPCPTGMLACHGNGNSMDNRESNLRWDTPKENTADIRRHGKAYCGERQHNAKLVPVDVERIRDQVRAGVMQKEVASFFRVSRTTICRIVGGEGWRHLSMGCG